MTDLSTIALLTASTAILCYALAALQGFKSAQSTSGPPALSRWSVLAALLHLLTITVHAVEDHGLSSSFFDALSITAFIVVAMSLLTQIRHALGALLAVIFIIAIAALALASLFAHHTPIVASSSGMLTHILSSIIAYSLLSLATVQAIALQQMERQLKTHHDAAWLRQLPPLQTMETLLFQLIGLGWLALTVGVISGALYVDDLFAQQLSHKTVFTLISWSLFGLLLIGRSQYGWRGATAVKWTLSAFAALLLGYFGSKFVLEVILHRG